MAAYPPDPDALPVPEPYVMPGAVIRRASGRWRHVQRRECIGGRPACPDCADCTLNKPLTETWEAVDDDDA